MASPQRENAYDEQFKKIVWTLDTFRADLIDPAPPGRHRVRCNRATCWSLLAVLVVLRALITAPEAPNHVTEKLRKLQIHF